MRHGGRRAFAAPGMAVLVMLGAARPSPAQDAAEPYPVMAPVGQYLMDRTAEIALARSAAPEAISRDATVMILGRDGYETAVEGSNGFVCMVGRGWGAAFDWAEYWSPKVRAADCMNPQAARSILPVTLLRARMVMAGRSKGDIISEVKAGYASGRLPHLEPGAMSYMMSPAAYLTDMGSHNLPHVMFYTLLGNAADWGAGAEGSPIGASPLWFFSPQDGAEAKGLPPILVFLVALSQ